MLARAQPIPSYRLAMQASRHEVDFDPVLLAAPEGHQRHHRPLRLPVSERLSGYKSLPQPFSKCIFVEFARSKSEYRGGGFHLRRLQAPAIDGQKQAHAEEGGAFVAIDKRTVLCNAHTVTGSQGRNIWLGVCQQVDRLASAESSKPSSRIPENPPCSARLSSCSNKRARLSIQRQFIWPVRETCRETRA